MTDHTGLDQRADGGADKPDSQEPPDGHSPDSPDGTALCPTAVINCPEGNEVGPQETVHFVGSQSFSAAGPITKWEWSVQQPFGSASVFLPGVTFPDPSFEINVAGVYKFSLDVWDSEGNKSCQPAKYEIINCGCSESIHIELLWNTPGDSNEADEGTDKGTDLNVHLAHPLSSQPDLDGDGAPDPWFDPVYDCFYDNHQPNWGSDNPSANDDPSLDRDDIDGGGPENINLTHPEKVVYRVGVDFFSDHGFGPAYATLRVYIDGVMLFEQENVLMIQADLWEVCTIDWVTHSVAPIVDVSGGHKMTHDYPNPDFMPPLD